MGDALVLCLVSIGYFGHFSKISQNRLTIY